MDEPTRMLDPIGAYELHELIKDRVASEGRTVLVATNLMAEAETLCDRLLLIDRGRPVLSGTVEEFRGAIRRETVYRLVVEGTFAPAVRALEQLPSVIGVAVESHNAGAAELIVTFDGAGSALPGIIRLLVDADVEIVSCHKEEVSLDQVFRTVVDREARACVP